MAKDKPKPLTEKDRVIANEYLDADCFDYEKVLSALAGLKLDVVNLRGLDWGCNQQQDILTLIDKWFVLTEEKPKHDHGKSYGKGGGCGG